MAHSGKQRVVLAAIAATSLLVAALLGYDIARRASSPAPQSAGPMPATGSTSPDTSANPLALSVLDQPRTLPEIRFADDQGHELTLADFRGRVVLLNIWATWCVPCRKEMPALDHLQAKLGGKDFIVIPLSIDREGVAAVRRFYEKLGLEKLGIYLDQSGKGSRALAHSRGADDVVNRPPRPRDGPQDGCRRVGRLGNGVAGRADDPRSIGQR